jgi:IS1 family transposase
MRRDLDLQLPQEDQPAESQTAPAHAGDVWTWTALDSDSKLVVSYFVGSRSGQGARFFMGHLASRVAGRIQLTTDGYQPYRNAVDVTFVLRSL